MATALDDILVPTAYRLINKYGQNAVFHETEVDASDYNPATGITTIPAASTHTEKVSPPSPYNQTLIDGDLIKVGDMKIYLAAQSLGFTPVRNMKVVAAGKTWRIVAANPLYSGEEIAAYELQLRDF